MRVAAQVASGIGFVGAGAILRQGLTVRGLTTAATLWSSAALGVAAGAGFFPGALAGFAAVFGALFALRYVRHATRRIRGLRELGELEDGDVTLEVDYERGRGTLSYLISEIEDAGGEITGLSITDDGDRGRPGIRHTSLQVRAPSRTKLAAVTDGVTELPEVRSVRVGDRSPTAA
jgi:putative Mg2+ transporter-C (MgtC) family protein